MHHHGDVPQNAGPAPSGRVHEELPVLGRGELGVGNQEAVHALALGRWHRMGYTAGAPPM